MVHKVLFQVVFGGGGDGIDEQHSKSSISLYIMQTNFNIIFHDLTRIYATDPYLS